MNAYCVILHKYSLRLYLLKETSTKILQKIAHSEHANSFLHCVPDISAVQDAGYSNHSNFILCVCLSQYILEVFKFFCSFQTQWDVIKVFKHVY